MKHVYLSLAFLCSVCLCFAFCCLMQEIGDRHWIRTACDVSALAWFAYCTQSNLNKALRSFQSQP